MSVVYSGENNFKPTDTDADPNNLKDEIISDADYQRVIGIIHILRMRLCAPLSGLVDRTPEQKKAILEQEKGVGD